MFHPITGYYYEPWHLRYIGVEAATDMANRGISTLEEYFGRGGGAGVSLNESLYTTVSDLMSVSKILSNTCIGNVLSLCMWGNSAKRLIRGKIQT